MFMGMAKAAYQPITTKTAAYTIAVADHGTLFNNKGAVGLVTFTLPPIANVQAGWWVDFYALVVAQNFAITAPTNKLVAFNNIAATTLTWSTAGNIAGNGARVIFDGLLYLLWNFPGSGSTSVSTIT